jgi:carboxyl-terminal processing protease
MKILKIVSLTFFALAAALTAHAQVQREDASSTTEKFNTLLYYIEQMYVDSVNAEELVETAIVKMLESLDPHSVYISSDELAAANEPLNGNFEGVGIQFNILKDTIFVVNPIPGGPSERLGIQAGDKIITVDGENVAGVGINNNDVMKLLKGPKGTLVKVGIKRAGTRKLIEFEIRRDKIPIYSVDASYMIDKTTGYIKVNRFAKTTMQELREALTKLKSQGMNTLVLDLQGNGGGLLNTSIEMADEFLSDNRLLVYTEGRAFPKDETYSRREGMFEKGKLVVLIDEGSASASEIVSGAIQDWDRGLIVGRRSFGKGLVQRPVQLPDGSAVRLTVQKYYTPSGRCIQKPYDDGLEAYQQEKYRRYETGELLALENFDLPDSVRFTTNIRKRTVYGGGGIMPDIFVPIDTSQSTAYFTDMLRKGLVNQFALAYVDKNRGSLTAQWTTGASFVKDFKVTEALEKELIAYVDKEGIPYVAADWKVSQRAIAIRLKALIGRNLFDYNVFYEVINVLNPAYMKAIQALRDGTFEKAKLAHSDF